MQLRSPLFAALFLASACNDTAIAVSTVGDVALTLTLPHDTDASSSESSSSSSSSVSDESGSDGIATSTAASDTTGTPSTCDDDPACGDGEDALTCPEQCTVCGDGIVSGDEPCDNGVNDSKEHYWFKPSSIACAPGCIKVEWCGDGKTNGPEPCDDGHKQTTKCEIDCSVPWCGDGIANPALDETCDDGNEADDDGCTADCKYLERRVFISSISVKGDMNAGWPNPYVAVGLDLADARCNALAKSGHLPGAFKAWLSDSVTSPSERFDTGFTGLYRLVSKSADVPGLIVAIGWSDLTDGNIGHPIDRDERGYFADDDLVWTNTATDGTRASDLHCDDWTSSKPLDTTTLGESGGTTTWTQLSAGQTCAGTYRFYCFEDPT